MQIMLIFKTELFRKYSHAWIGQISFSANSLRMVMIANERN